MGLTGSTRDDSDEDRHEAQTVALSWQETELVGALKRLANARSQLSTLEAEAAAAASGPKLTPAEAQAITGVHAELETARAKTRSRLGRSSAQKRADALESKERELLAAAGLADHDAFRAWQTDPSPSSPVDPAVLDFARREVRGAEAAWLEIQSMEMPEPEAQPPPAAVADDEQPRLAHPEAS